jgi:hypothetical protein
MKSLQGKVSNRLLLPTSRNDCSNHCRNCDGLCRSFCERLTYSNMTEAESSILPRPA